MSEEAALRKEEYRAFQHMVLLLTPQRLESLLGECGIKISDFGSTSDTMPRLTTLLTQHLAPEPDRLCTVAEALIAELPLQPMAVVLQRLAVHLKAYLAQPIATRAPYSFLAEAGFGPASPIDLQPAVATVATGLNELDRARPNAAVAALLDAFQSQLASASELLVLLRAYKDIHDKLHGIQVEQLGRLTRLAQSQSRDAYFDVEVDELALAVSDMADQIRSVAGNIESYGGRSLPWADEIEKALQPLEGRAPGDSGPVRDVILKLRSMLRKQLPPINRRLVEVARDFPFAALIELLDRAARETEASPAARASFRSGSDELSQIHKRLRRTIDAHNAWQDLDRELWDLEAGARLADASDIEALDMRWADIVLPAVDAVTAIEDNQWAVALRKAADDFGAALAAVDAAEPQALLVRLAAFVQSLRRQFKSFDGHLLEACTSIMPLQKQLRSLSAEELPQ